MAWLFKLSDLLKNFLHSLVCCRWAILGKSGQQGEMTFVVKVTRGNHELDSRPDQLISMFAPSV
jgi:hypothetical protein